VKFSQIARSTALALALTLVATACGGSAETAASSEPAATEVPAEVAVTTPPVPTSTEIPPEPTAVPTEVPEPTATPVPEPTATAVPEPTAEPEPEPTEESSDAAAPDADASTDGTQPEETQPESGDADGAATDPADQADPVADLGATIYAGSCAGCHGDAGGGTGLGPSIRTVGQFFPVDDSALVALVTNGGTNMPQFGTKLTAEEIDAVVDWVVATFQ